MTDRILATYLLETLLPLERAVRVLASEGSTGTFVAVPGETETVRSRFGTSVESIEELAPSDRVHLIGARGSLADDASQVHRARVTVSVPLELTGTDLATVGACLLGNVFELSEVSGLRLEAIRFPPALIRACSRPRYGVAGTRDLLGVRDRPIFGSRLRPAIGLRPDETAAEVRELLSAGVEFVKDGELMASPPHSPLEARVAAVMRVIDEHEQRTGRRVLYAFNVTGEPDAMLRHQDVVQAAGGRCVQVSVVHAGLAAVSHLRRHGDLVIHGDRTGFAMQTRSAGLGMSYAAYAALWRLAGVDHMVVSGLRNTKWEPDGSAIASMRACLEPMLDESDRALPVVTGGQWGDQIPDTYRLLGTCDWLHLADTGVTDHPDGPTAGLLALQQAWDAARTGEALDRYATGAPELAASIRAFGSGLDGAA